MAFMRDANNLNWAFVCKQNLAASTGVINEHTDILDGQVVVVSEANKVRTAALSAGDQFKLMQRKGDKLIISPLFTFQSATDANYAAAAQQVTTIGSNGTTTVGLGEFGVADDTAAAAAVGNSYYVLIEKNDNDEANRQGYAPSITAQVKLTNPNGHTNAELLHVRLGELLREAVRKNDQLEADRPNPAGSKYVSCAVRAVATEAAPYSSGSGQTMAVTFGSKTVTASTATNLAVVAGDAITFGANGDIYRVASVSGATITLDFPYAGATDATVDVSATLAAGSVSRITAANLAAVTGVGLALTGIDQHEFDVDRNRMYSQSRFNVRFAKGGDNVGSTIDEATAANEGVNDWRTVASDVYTSMGNLGQRGNSDTPAVLRDTIAHVSSSAAGFGLIDIEVRTDKKELLWNSSAKQRVRLYLEYTDADGVSGTGTAQLQTVFGTSVETT